MKNRFSVWRLLLFGLAFTLFLCTLSAAEWAGATLR